MKKTIIALLFFVLSTESAFSLIKVDITRGNLDPLPIAVSPLHVDSKSEDLKSLKDKKETKQIVKKKQNPEEIKPQIRQSSEFEKEELFDTNEIAALIDKAKEEQAETQKKSSQLTQSNVKTPFAKALSLSEEDALRAQIFGCLSVPLGLP